MNIIKMKSKIAYINVTKCSVYYDGSLGIDEDIMKKANISEHEQVHVLNVNNNERFITYAIKEPAGSNNICLYGPAANKGSVGDEVVILTYCSVSPDEPVNPIVLNYRAH